MDENKEQEGFYIKDVYMKIRDEVIFLCGFKKSIIFFAFLCSIGAGLFAYLSKPVYEAEASFVLNDDTSGGALGAFGGIASQFGLNIGGGGGGFFSSENIRPILRSKKLIRKALFSQGDFAGKKVLLINRYIDFNKLHEKWEKNEDLKGFYFPAGVVDNGKLPVAQDSVLTQIYNKIIKEDLKIDKEDKKAGVFKIIYASEDEVFAKLFIEQLLNSSITFYVETSTKKAQVLVDMLQFKTDSIRTLLEEKLADAARFKDINIGMIRASGKAQEIKKDREVEMLYIIYGELVKNLEISKTNLVQSTPIIQVIDSPTLPLKKEKYSKLIFLLAGGIIGGIVACLFLLIRKYTKHFLA